MEEIFRRPVGHNIQWHDVVSLLGRVGTVDQRHDGRLAVTLGAETQIFELPRHGDIDEQQGEIDEQQVVDLQRMLQGITPAAASQ